MDVRLDDIDLVKRVQDGPDEPIREVRTVIDSHVEGRRSIVELAIPGSSGNVLQDMGREPIRIALVGEFWGPDGKGSAEALQGKYESGDPLSFTSDLATAAEVSQVIISALLVEEVSGAPSRYRYSLLLSEYVEPREPAEEQPADQGDEAEEQAEQEGQVEDIRGRILGSDGNPVGGVTVRIKGPSEYEVATDADGYYEALDVPEGRYEITVEAEGYEGIRGEIEVRKGETEG